MDVACSAVRVFRNPADISRHGMVWTTPRNGNTAIGSVRLASPVRIGESTTGSSSRTGSQAIISPRGSIGPQWSRDAQTLDISINGIYSEHTDPAPTWRKVIGRKFTNKSSANIISRYPMNLTCNAVLTESLNSVNMGLSSVHTTDELGYVFIPTTRIRTPMNGFNWIQSGHHVG